MPTQPFVNACLLLNVARSAKVSWVYFFCSNYCRRSHAKQQNSTISAAVGQIRNEKCCLLACAQGFLWGRDCFSLRAQLSWTLKRNRMKTLWLFMTLFTHGKV
jgi:hypothetical protein